jgi:hypothetical protein
MLPPLLNAPASFSVQPLKDEESVKLLVQTGSLIVVSFFMQIKAYKTVIVQYHRVQKTALEKLPIFF